MAITSVKHMFTKGNIDLYAPNSAGVYGLYDPITTVIYYGMSDISIKSRLHSHFDGTEGSCTRGATYF